jgi:hypothetical protein
VGAVRELPKAVLVTTLQTVEGIGEETFTGIAKDESRVLFAMPVQVFIGDGEDSAASALERGMVKQDALQSPEVKATSATSLMS